MTVEEKRQTALELLTALEANDDSALASAIARGVVRNNPDLAPMEMLGAGLLQIALGRMRSGSYGWVRRLWPF